MRTEWGEPPGAGGPAGVAFPRLTDVTRKLLWVNGIAFLVLFLLRRLLPATGAWSLQLLALVPGLWWEWAPFVPLWQLLSYGFLHSTSDVFHLLFNMLALYFFGTMVEGIVGPRRFLFTYLAALGLGGLAQLTAGLIAIARRLAMPELAGLSPVELSVPTLGASGAVMCMIVAAAVMQPDTRVIFILFPLKLRTLALILVGIDVFRMLNAESSVAWLVHLTGAAFGFLAVRQRWIWSDPLASLERWRGARRHSRERDDERRLNELLDRIHREGMHSLSRAERTFLKRVSSRRR